MEPQAQFTPSFGEEESAWSKFKSNFVELIEFAAVMLAVLVIIRFFIAEPHRVSGHSMDTNFQDGDYIITNKLSLRLGEPVRGEVIILKNPRNPEKDVFIKRVIGLPGEQIKISAGKFYINGQPLEEPYLPTEVKTSGGMFLPDGEIIIIPDGQYFVAGDNRGGSSDSREWGPVKRDLIIGQAWLRYWPIPAFKLIKIAEASLEP